MAGRIMIDRYMGFYRTSRLAFEVRKPSRSGSKETGETDLGRVLPMNLRVYSRLSTLE